MRTEYLNYSPYKLKEIRDLVDAYEAGELELENQPHTQPTPLPIGCPDLEKGVNALPT